MRPSLSNPGNQARAQYAATGYDYNLRLGPTFLTLGTSLGLEYNDNINVADSHNTDEAAPKADFIYRPSITVHSIWPATKLNVLTLDLGLGVERHINHPEYDQNNVTVSPNTQLSFDVYVGNVRLNFHDSLSIQQNASTRADAVNTGAYSQLSNTTGVSALWDLNKSILQASYDYNLTRFTGSSYENQNSGSHIFNGAISFPITAAVAVGLQANYVLTVYEDANQPNITTTSVGPFIQVSPSRYTSIQASGGLQNSTYDYSQQANTTNFLAASSSSDTGGDSFYYNVTFQNRLNRLYQQSLVLTRERQLGLSTNLVQTSSVSYTLQWQANSHITLSANAFYQRGQQNTLFNDEEFDYYGGGISFGYRLTRHLSTGFHYTHTERNSNLPFNDYSQNIVGLDFSYDF